MKKKVRLMALCCLCGILLLGLTGCECRHKYDAWKVDTICHWHICEKCGKELHTEGHDFALGNQCRVCEFYTYPDEGGTTVMESYDEMGAKAYHANYNEDGTLEAYQRYENTYFKDGTIESMKAFGYERQLDEEGTERALWENHFRPYEGGEEGEVYLYLDVMYETDGTKITREYNQAGELVKEERS